MPTVNSQSVKPGLLYSIAQSLMAGTDRFQGAAGTKNRSAMRLCMANEI